jgi:hypothetical protein
MPNRVRIAAVRDDERVELQRRARSKAEPVRVAQRARIVLLAEQGLTGRQITKTTDQLLAKIRIPKTKQAALQTACRPADSAEPSDDHSSPPR